jgi:chaperonin cofactor prefoldin
MDQVNKRLEVVQANETILEKQIQRLHHIIQREVGDHIPLQKVPLPEKCEMWTLSIM